jgi:hypothetical protein
MVPNNSENLVEVNVDEGEDVSGFSSEKAQLGQNLKFSRMLRWQFGQSKDHHISYFLYANIQLRF